LSVGLESKPKRKIVKLKMIMSGPITLTRYLFLKSIAMEQRWDLVMPRQGDQYRTYCRSISLVELQDDIECGRELLFQRRPDVQRIRNSRTGPERGQNRCGAFSPVRRAVESSLLLSQAPFGRHFRKCESNALRWFGTSMNWMHLAPNTRHMPTIVVVAVEAAEMQYDSIERSEIS
jgi:hypothetical protein